MENVGHNEREVGGEEVSIGSASPSHNTTLAATKSLTALPVSTDYHGLGRGGTFSFGFAPFTSDR